MIAPGSSRAMLSRLPPFQYQQSRMAGKGCALHHWVNDAVPSALNDLLSCALLSNVLDFVFSVQIFKTLFACLDHFATCEHCLDPTALTLHHLETMAITITLDRLDILKEDLVSRVCVKFSMETGGKDMTSAEGGIPSPSLMYPVESKNLLEQGFSSLKRRVSYTEFDTSLIHIESRKSPTAELFDDDSGRISIRHCEY
ncbi:hypothetical protein Tco_1265096 [Tanacetum coccineum]